ncbi:bifunctional phosphoribosylaminoimidazolecarboxamide formyltransferase/IMP cyclohydrolase [Candidatus Xianfuyuplasma coldseepsis]|uniref:Bifunctional purine biosynthesis protein PurH n=1 Tax=Candidatus Xianfuyuplasma coldseepsis TaxID=2782163 RepID=A0A7L7KQP4_9MOLU|nr:bifunctional phosphoribosylaminoimidazolecarboxamide formyltransferase/IMP cyclohydrolase [Xianfuyuplasma coldseepsis]QMS85043.1 bifunctional phosphoribosylaminoimidazolecarboxamide formyltransferase/IMP cyclohydrolase [Xianfuyuplasma coldseepsis]
MKRALISVSDKTNIAHFASALISHGFEIISTGKTKQILDEAGVLTKSVEDITGFPEILDGRVKTLHPKIHGGILSLRNKPHHIDDVVSNNIEYIDLVCVNLYPFKETISVRSSTFDEAVEQIDIGGPSLLRSAAKNYEFVTVVTDINDYNLILTELESYGDTLPETKRQLSAKAFRTTAKYDSIIANYFTSFDNSSMIDTITISGDFKQHLRYGENPHQKAALYQLSDDPYSILQAILLNGKPLSYNNIQDANAAINILAEHSEPTAVALKHMNPCGVGTGETIFEAYQKAYKSDTISIYGGIVALNRVVTTELGFEINKLFLEIIIAPGFSKDALSILRKKKNLRILQLDTSQKSTDTVEYNSVNGGLLIQNIDKQIVSIDELHCVTKRFPSERELEQLHFAWKVVKHVKSNGIVITSGTQTVGVGAGQMNRVGAAKIALEQARNNGFTENLTLASDAFFPFDDVVKLAYEYGVNHIVQPGGSIRDNDSITACDNRYMTMVFTNNRHFKH